MTQSPRTTESASRDNAAIRDIMNQIRDRLTVPDRATLALGLIGHLATMMNGRQIEKLLGQLTEEAMNVQDVPPKRRAAAQSDDDRHDARTTDGRSKPDEVGAEGRGALTDDAGPIL